jgi:hypothetical protein
MRSWNLTSDIDAAASQYVDQAQAARAGNKRHSWLLHVDMVLESAKDPDRRKYLGLPMLQRDQYYRRT